MKPSEAKKYSTRYSDCYKRDCFVPFAGNGIKICRPFELGQCREKEFVENGKTVNNDR